MKVLVTGASGFVGRPLVSALAAQGHSVTALSRTGTSLAGAHNVRIADFADVEALDAALAGQDSVVHVAARVHVMEETTPDPLAEFRKANRDLTIDLARRAAAAGVKRFIFLSSVKVFGETSSRERPFRADDAPNPVDPYAISKWEAEQALGEVAATTGLEVTVIRPPLIYGPGVGANFRRLVKLVDRGIPLPFGAIRNRRSLVAIDNLVDLIGACLVHPMAAGRTFVVSDGEPMTTADILRAIARGLGRPAHLVNVPENVLVRLLTLVGKSAYAQRLVGSLHVDLEPTRTQLDWTPRTGVDDAFRTTVQDIRDNET